jgi:site-specific DNA recombinase
VIELDDERKRLARGVITGAIPEDLGLQEQHRIARELTQAQNVLATARVIYAHIEETLNRALALVGRIDEVYRLGGPRVRRLVNQCFFDKLLISVIDDRPQVAGATLREPWSTLLAAEFIQEMRAHTTNLDHVFDGRGLKMMSMVGAAGFEPATPRL